MCLSIPAEVVSIENDRAMVSVGGAIYNASLKLVDDIHAGDFVLIHSGYAIQKIDKKAADDTLNFLHNITKEI